ncbi:MAG: 2-amino-4-hydroxy-6-hydroxymethyldihydropteridine diphosphokinase [Hyphomicrobium sp.]
MAVTNPAGAEISGAPALFDAILALGTNIGDRAANIDDAIGKLGDDGSVEVVARSRRYRTAPWGVTDQDWFVNACVGVRTKLSPHALLKRCQAVENAMGRVRTQHWGPRIIDVDILVIGEQQISEPDLIVPHPLISERAFVLVPLRDVAPDLTIAGQTIEEMLSRLDAGDVVPLEP